MAARKKPVLIGTVLPLGSAGLGAPARSTGTIVLNGGPDAIYIGTEDQSLFVIGRLTGPANDAPPEPRYSTTERHHEFSLVGYTGHDPYEMAVPIKFDRAAAGRSVEPDIRALWRLLGGGSATHPIEPPVVRVVGRVPHTSLRWRVRSVEPVTGRTQYLPNTDQRCRFACVVNLIQHVADEKLTATWVGGPAAKGIRARTTTVKRGEDLFDVSKRMYGDRSHVRDLAGANDLSVGAKLRAGQKLRVP